MNFFNMMYESKGAGIEKDAPKKTGLALLFEIVCRDGWDICKMAALCIISCVPIVTIPAALAGFHAVLMRILRDVPGDPWFDFRQGWKTNWKKAVPVTLGFGLLAALLRFASQYYMEQASIMSAFSLVCTGLLLLTAMAAVYVFPMLTVVELETGKIIKNAFLLALARPHHAIAGVVSAVLMATMASLLPVVVWPLWAVLSFAVTSVVADWAAWSGIKAFIIH